MVSSHDIPWISWISSKNRRIEASSPSTIMSMIEVSFFEDWIDIDIDIDICNIHIIVLHPVQQLGDFILHFSDKRTSQAIPENNRASRSAEKIVNTLFHLRPSSSVQLPHRFLDEIVRLVQCSPEFSDIWLHQNFLQLQYEVVQIGMQEVVVDGFYLRLGELVDQLNHLKGLLRLENFFQSPAHFSNVSLEVVIELLKILLRNQISDDLTEGAGVLVFLEGFIQTRGEVGPGVWFDQPDHILPC